jgi:1-acyl-sn-glycerol-3-phosphate acyltransferase
VSRRRRKERLDKLDAALDGRLVEVDEDLAPLVETVAELRGALAGVELDPEAAERHLGMILDGEAKVVALPTGLRPQISRWRRRVAAVALAAALTVLPAIMASASALPGQALYPVKLAVEQLQVTAVSWSSTREAGERIRIANNRLDELDRLIQLNAADRIAPAIVRLHQA